MTFQGIFASLLIIFFLYLFVRWADRKRRKDKKAKVVEMDIEEYDFETYHKN